MDTTVTHRLYTVYTVGVSPAFFLIFPTPKPCRPNLMLLSALLILTLTLTLTLSGCGGEDSNCAMLFIPEAGACVETELRSIDFCEGLYVESLAEDCEAQFGLYVDCLYGTDECRDCQDAAEALLACGQAPGTPCGELYYELDDGCLNREFEGDVEHCRRVYDDATYADCRADYEEYARCLADISFRDPDSCYGVCDSAAAYACLSR